MEICAQKADDAWLEELKERVATDPKIQLTPWEAIRLLLHIEFQNDRIEEVAVERDIARDDLDLIRNTMAS